jgi:hypothetical protein
MLMARVTLRWLLCGLTQNKKKIKIKKNVLKSPLLTVIMVVHHHGKL